MQLEIQVFDYAYKCDNHRDLVNCQNYLFKKGFYWLSRSNYETIDLPDEYKYPIYILVDGELLFFEATELKSEHLKYKDFSKDRENKLKRILK